MVKVLIDANVLIAAVNPTELHFARACEILAETTDAAVTELVANETANVIVRRRSKKQSIESMAQLVSSGIEIIYLDDQTFMQTLQLFKAWNKSSFADAANIIMMRKLGITRIATFDQAFKQIPGIEVVC